MEMKKRGGRMWSVRRMDQHDGREDEDDNYDRETDDNGDDNPEDNDGKVAHDDDDQDDEYRLV